MDWFGLGGFLGGNICDVDYEAQARAQAAQMMAMERAKQQAHWNTSPQPEGVIIDAEYEIVEEPKLLTKANP